jgi:hypothetical protein
MIVRDGYKVVHEDRGTKEVASAIGGVGHSGRAVRYFKTRRTYPAPGCGPLCVFKTLLDAKSFQAGSDLTVYECTYQPSTRKIVWYTFTDSVEKWCVQKSSLDDLSVGKALAEWVQLGKEVR